VSLDSLRSTGLITTTTYKQLTKLVDKRSDQYFVIDKEARLKAVDTKNKQNPAQRIYQSIRGLIKPTSADKDQVGASVLFSLRNLTKAISTAQSQKTLLSEDAMKGLAKVVIATNQLAQETLSLRVKQKLLGEAAKIQQNIKQDEFLWAQKTCPSMASDIKNVQYVLEASENSKLPLNQRMQLTPRPPQAAGEGVTFFVSTVRCTVPDPSKSMKTEVETAKAEQIKPRLIVKSAVRERDMGDTLNFINGQGPMRERIAYTAQKELGLDCGVPQTVMTRLAHSVFSNDSAINAQLQIISRELNVPVDLQKVVNFCEGGPNPELFRANMLEKTFEDLKVAVTSPAWHKELDAIITKLKEDPSSNYSLSEDLAKANKLSGGAIEGYLELIRGFVTPNTLLDDAVKEAWNLSYHPETTEATLVSCQHIVGGCKALSDMSEEEIAMISPKQFEKCVIDLLLINSDRGLQNLLAKEIPIEELSEKMAGALKIPQALFQEAIQDLKLHPNSNLNKGMLALLKQLGDKTGRKIELTNREESLLNALLHAKANRFTSALELILIDNSQSMPRLIDPQSGRPLDPLTNANPIHGWESLPQAAVVLSGKAKSKIQQLDADAYVQNVRADQQAHLERYGSHCAIDDSCFDLLKINILFLKEAVNQGMSIKEMNRFLKKTPTNTQDGQVRYGLSPFQKLYREHFTDSVTKQPKTADWQAVTKDIQEFIIQLQKN